MRVLAYILTAGLVAVIATATYWLSFQYFQSDEQTRASARLSLYRSTVLAELERFSHLTYVLARDPYVIDTAAGGDTDALNARLRSFAARAGLDAIYLMEVSGVTRAASNAGEPGSFVGQDYSFRPYFKDAQKGVQGRFYGIGATTGLPGYFYADAVYGQLEELLGVVAIKLDLSVLQDRWREAGEQVILANGDGVVLLSSNPDWLYRVLDPLTPAQRERIVAARQFPGQDLAPLDWQRSGAGRAILNGENLLHLSVGDLPHGWSLHYFANDDAAVTRSWLLTGSVVLAAGLAIILFQIQRAQRITAALRRSEQEEAALRLANERLAVEIDERRTAERRLQRTQGELERAGRLAALGQLAASVTHELGQPISAMRNHLAAAEIQSGQSVLTDRLQGLVERMEGITRQLKFFARKGRDKFEPVDLREAMQAVLELMAPNLSARDVAVRTDWPEEPVTLVCNRLRIEQVMTNLLRNALDAMQDQDRPAIDIAIGSDPDAVWFTVADNGHGFGARAFAELSEPFATTRESGQGMGLGLAISTVIVEDHQGRMVAENRDGGGALIRVSFPREQAET